MKKILLILFALIMCTVLCACSEPVTDEQLSGNWDSADDGSGVSLYFDTSTHRIGYVYTHFYQKGSSDSYGMDDYEVTGGNYTINGNKITITFDENTQFGKTCTLTYNDGKLKIGSYTLKKSD